MVTTRRSGIPLSTPRKPNDNTASAPGGDMPTSTVFIPPPTHSPHLPTRTEAILFSIYPLTLFFGSLFSHISPTLRPPFNASVYSHAHQSFQPASSAPSYFAQKRNVFNVYFVKIGWFWCTLAFFVFLFFVGRGRSTPPKVRHLHDDVNDDETTRTEIWRSKRDEQDQRIRRRYQALLRWAICTMFWVFTTQWFFGPPFVDRGFALTGGACEMAEKQMQREDLEGGRKVIAKALTHATCKAAGGLWRGGYDISGHVFILVLGSGMLWLEMLPFLLPGVKGLSVGRVISAASGEVIRVANEIGAFELYVKEIRTSDEAARKAKAYWTVKACATTMTMAIGVLSWWMLLMTAAFFHTWFEKVTGWLLASTALWVVYLLPRAWPGLRSIVGMPGV